MDWNNYYPSGVNQNFNFPFGNFHGGGNVPSYQGNENWNYFSYNNDVGAENTMLQPVVPNHSRTSQYGNVTNLPAERNYARDISAANYVQNPGQPNSYCQDSSVALALSSSLTATAGEFIPRSRNSEASYVGAEPRFVQKPPQDHSQDSRSSAHDKTKQNIGKRNMESKYFHSSRNAASSQDSSNWRGGRLPQPQFKPGQYGKSSNNEEKKRDFPSSEPFENSFHSISHENGVASHSTSSSAVQQPIPIKPFSSRDTNEDSEYFAKSRDTYFNHRSQYNQNGNRKTKKKPFSKYDDTNDSSNGSRNYYSQDGYQNGRGRKHTMYRASDSASNESGSWTANRYGNSFFVGNSGPESLKFNKEKNNFSPRVYEGRNNFTSLHNTSSSYKEKNYMTDDDVSQRECLSEQLSRGTLECLVCCDRVRQHDAIWSCSNCYHVLHLKCIKKWAKSSQAETGWRCPACQNVTCKVPQEYRCFCGKMRDPDWNRQDVPHSCGEVCGKSRPNKQYPCVHRCTLLCHPGPCPPCSVQVSRNCGCGKTVRVVMCGSDQALLCNSLCEKDLSCGAHKCEKTCHIGECGDCVDVVKQVCFCGKTSREVKCTVDTWNIKYFSCEDVCNKDLSCGNHKCLSVCHEGACNECCLVPEKVTHCPCGKMKLEVVDRKSCLDPVPTCDKICRKKLPCGQPGNNHVCQGKCHSGQCPPCSLTTFVKCRCGHMDKEIECKDLTTKADDARCEKRCSKKRSCGRHKCNQTCCIDIDHVCPLVCNHMLSCGQHRCEELCHRGHCQPCWRTSFEELFCECGASVIYPPVPCGTRRPECTRPCSRQHSCEHPALHRCHSDPSCPPCTVLMQKYCYGKHELRKAVPCHQLEFSCGMPCGKPLSCGRHKCILPCHKGECLKEGQICVQPCSILRGPCGHPCAAACHEGVCPETLCKETVRVTCECGHRSTSRPCCDQAKEYQRVMTALLASKMHEMQLGHSVDIGDLGGNQHTRALSLKTLECNDECKLIERNRRLTIGLQIRNPDLGGKLQPRYSEFMRQWAKKDSHFVSMVHEKLTELVQLAKQSKQKSRSFSFSSMNREKRHFIHEYCEHFGCESQAYDPEPNRNVVATAHKDKAWLPGMSLLEVLQRESGQRKIPKPVTARAVDTKLKETSTPLRSALQKSNFETLQKTEKKEEEEEIDYFEFTS